MIRGLIRWLLWAMLILSIIGSLASPALGIENILFALIIFGVPAWYLGR